MRIYFFCDLETSGLDPELDRIVEIGWLYADRKLRRLSTTSFTPVRPVGGALKRIMGTDVVREMHENTGLLYELLNNHELPLLAAVESSILQEFDEIENRYQEFVAGLTEEERFDSDITEHVEFVIAGKNVYFDRGFIVRYMPRLAKRLSHRTFDETSLRYAMDALGIGINVIPETTSSLQQHRAGFDAELSFTTSRFVVAQLQQLMSTSNMFDEDAPAAFVINSSDGEFEQLDIHKELDDDLRNLSTEN